MSKQFLPPSVDVRCRWSVLALALAGLLATPAIAAERMVLGEEFSAAW